MTAWYPPDAGAAAERVASFARHLPDLGWHCHVLCPAREIAPPPLPGVTVHTVRDLLWRPGHRFADYDPQEQPSRWSALARRWLFPDRFVLWRRAALREARRVVSTHRLNVLLASFPPASAAQLGAAVQKRTGLPLILDLRDRWLGEGGYQPSSERQRRRHVVLERWCASRATAIIAVSDVMAQAIAAEHDLPAAHVLSIPNGYEPSGRPPRPAERPAGKPVVVAHVGTVIPRNRPDRFLESLLRLDQESDLSGIMFRFVGNLSPGYVERLGLASVAQTTGLVSRDAARQEMHVADALLLLVGAYVGHWGHNAKVFEYIQTGRPILCLEEKPGSNDRRLIERFAADRAFFAALGDAEALAMELRRLREYLHRHSQPAIELDDAFREYSRPQQAACLAECLERAWAGWR